MKRHILSILFAILAIAGASAQAVYSVSGSGNLPLPLSFPDIKNNIIFTADVEVVNMGTLILERSSDRWSGTTVKINQTSVEVYYGTVLRVTKQHNLKINKNLRITLNIVNADVLSNNERTLLTLMSDGHYVSIPIPFGGARDGFVLKDESGKYGKAQCNAYTMELNHEIWGYGDSYYDYCSPLVYADGFDIMFDFFGGRVSTQALASLKKELKVATPKTIIWAMGMNDIDGSNMYNQDWYSSLMEVEDICKNKGIRLVLTTIPNVPARNNSLKNKYIRESGYEYIDVCKAVGADNNSSWYTGLLGSDQLHPSPDGCQVIRKLMEQFLKGGVDDDQVAQDGVVYQENDEKTAYTVVSTYGAGLTSYCVPATINDLPVTTIGENAFSNLTSLTELTFEEGSNIEKIGTRAFMAIGITNLDLTPCTKLTSISERAFANCTKLAKVTFNKELQNFDGPAQFNGCTALQTITFPDGCELGNISAYAFQNDKNFKAIRIPAAVKVIEKEAFGWGGADSRLAEVTFEENSQLEQLGELAFRNCKNLKKCDLSNCKELKTILWDVFYGCGKLETVNLDQCTKLKSIDGSAFRGTKLYSISLPASLTSVGSYSFNECSYLTNVTCLAPEPPTAYDNTFGNTTYATTLHVAEGCADKYAAATGWKKFKNIDETAVNAIYTLTFSKENVTYCIDGTKFAHTYKGITIRNGKKILIK